MSDFLPTNYSVPEAPSKYMKFQQGENKIRILTSPVIGYEWWVREDGTIKTKDDMPAKGDRPVRIRMNGRMPADAGETFKHFWAMVVWNYNAEQVQILQINQRTIQKPLKDLAKDEDWGSPVGAKGYDIVITKEGEKLQTEYSVKAKPRKEIDEGIIKMADDMDINLEALFDGGDPFNSDVDPKEVKV